MERTDFSFYMMCFFTLKDHHKTRYLKWTLNLYWLSRVQSLLCTELGNRENIRSLEEHWLDNDSKQVNDIYTKCRQKKKTKQKYTSIHWHCLTWFWNPIMIYEQINSLQGMKGRKSRLIFVLKYLFILGLSVSL